MSTSLDPVPAASPAHDPWVIDTNIWLDLFIFVDPRCSALEAAISRGSLNIVISERCRDEFDAVIALPRWEAAWQQRHGTPFDRAILQGRLRTLTQMVEVDTSAPPVSSLPLCSDPHDQKFLQLVAASGARGLITKDRALLKLARRMRAWNCHVMLPQDWNPA
jgi:putative PIN family toxin of toxin-antitoxin system